jgi:CRISPR-associated endonuclease/helicase Cas3
VSSYSEFGLISHPDRSLFSHLRGVDEVSRRALAAKVLSNDIFGAGAGAEEIRKLLVYFHDFGKAIVTFQYRIIAATKGNNEELDGLDANYVADFRRRSDYLEIAQLVDQRPDLLPHSPLGALVALAGTEGQYSELLRLIMAEIIFRHHGHLRDMVSSNFPDREYIELGEEMWQRCDLDNLRPLLAEAGYTFAASYEEVRRGARFSTFRRAYRVLKRATDYTPFLQTRFLFSLLLAGDKGDLMLPGAELTASTTALPDGLIDQYKERKFGDVPPTEINRMREEAYQRVQETLDAHSNRGFYSITLPTGLGKTLTAYSAAVGLQRLMQADYASQGKDCTPRIIYCLPFTSVIDQNASVLDDILDTVGLQAKLIAKHHYLADWPNQKDEVTDQLTYSEREYLVEGWEYTLTVTTFVQFVDTLFSNRNRQLRKFHNLANAVVILDEVQNIPAKYFEAVARSLKLLHEYLGTRFIFVTATQPFLMPAGCVTELTDVDRTYTRQVFTAMNRIDLDLSLWQDGPEDLNELIPIFKAAVAKEPGRSFLFILNLVRESQLVFDELKSAAEPNTTYLYLSSAILPVLRQRIIERVKSRRPDGERLVVVSTQVVEAGVDIDLDVVYRAFAPLDSINQSAGRCNRNGKQSRGSVRLFHNQQSAGKIYGDLSLRYTERVLREAIEATGDTLIPEAAFFDLNEAYAEKVRAGIAEGNEDSARILEGMRQLLFERVASEVQLIDHGMVRYGVFIDDPQHLPSVTIHDGRVLTTSQLWQLKEHILHDKSLGRWDKKRELRLLRPALLRYVVQFPERYLPEELREEAADRPFIRLAAEEGMYDYRRCYDLITGYFEEDDPIIVCC